MTCEHELIGLSLDDDGYPEEIYETSEEFDNRHFHLCCLFDYVERWRYYDSLSFTSMKQCKKCGRIEAVISDRED